MISVTAPDVKREDLEKAVDADLEVFNKWVTTKLGEPIVRSERAILKAYLWYKIVEERDAIPDQTTTTEGSHGA